MSLIQDKIRFAGDVRINEVTIINSRGFAQTITPQVAGIEIFEDIFSPIITGTVIVRESHDLIGLFPLVGDEFIKLQVATPSLPVEDTYTNEFFIYKVSDRFKTAEREVAYIIHFMSKEGLVDANKKISRTYSGKISDIAKKIIADQDALETIKPANVEPTANSTKYTSNFWSPIQNLLYLTGTAVNDNKSPSYVFFETKYGLNFVSLDSLYQLPIKQEFIWDQYSQDISPLGGSTRNIDEDYKRILQISTPEVVDYIDRATSGMYASRVVHYDLTTKLYTSKNFIAKDQFSKTNHLNPYSVISNEFIGRPNAVIINEHKYYGNYTGYGDVTNAKVVQHRTSLLKQAEAFKVEITVPGRTDYTAGQKINLKLYKMAQLQEDTTPEDFLDKIYSGNYLIGAINHSITKESHECRMQLIKDSFMLDLDKR